jgi:hypothetical protein
VAARLWAAHGRFKVIDACHPRHRHQEFLKFRRPVAKATCARQLHIVLDSYGTHKHPKVNAWLERNPRVHLHFTPTSGSWRKMVETFFSIITRQAIRQGTFPSVEELIDAFAATSTPGTNAANRSSGPRTPRPSSQERTVKTSMLQDANEWLERRS